MPSLKDLRKRISSVKNTQQTTKAMKMVSAAKLRRASDAIHAQRPYAKEVGRLVQMLAGVVGDELKSPYFSTAEQEAQTEGKSVLLVLFTSDRGLCGGFNSSIIKTTQRWVATNGSKYARVQIAFVGKKAYEFFKTRHSDIGEYFEGIIQKPTFIDARKISENLIEKFTSGEFQEIKLVYNEFKNAVSQKVVFEEFLPIAPIQTQTQDKEGFERVYLVKPAAPALLNQLLKKTFAIQVWRVILESLASEHGARMAAMDNATRNAGEMIRKLALVYNKTRQAGITKELLEIVSGAESAKSSA